MQPTQWRWNHKAPPHFAVSHSAWLREHAIITSSLPGSPHSQAGAPSAMVPRASLLTPLATRLDLKGLRRESIRRKRRRSARVASPFSCPWPWLASQLTGVIGSRTARTAARSGAAVVPRPAHSSGEEEGRS
jgi:hypothetical protein